jgi:hypothetical protein
MAQLYACSQRDLLRKKINICMTNSDNRYGTFNKSTLILTQVCDNPTALITFATVAEAKSFFYTDAALAVFDECCTELQWELVEDAKGLKYTRTFGTKGGNIAAADDWAGQFNSRKTALINANGWSSPARAVPINCYTVYITHNCQEVDSHLF